MSSQQTLQNKLKRELSIITVVRIWTTERSHIAGGSVNLHSFCRKPVGIWLVKLNINILQDKANPLLCLHPSHATSELYAETGTETHE